MDRIILHDLMIKQLENRSKKIRVFLPRNYYESNDKYPVLYMHDGQNLVDPAPFSGYSWDIQNTMDQMQDSGILPGMIIVGIDNDQAQRVCEYSGAFSKSAKRHAKRDKPQTEFVPEGKEYAAFIVKELKPFIDKTYRTLSERKNTGIAGSSCGGNISIYMICWYKDVFRFCGAFSPAYSIVGKDLFDLVGKTIFPDDTYIYHDMGTKENIFPRLTYLPQVYKLQKILKNKGFDKEHLYMNIDKQATHTDLFWQARFPEFLEFAFSSINQ